MSLFTEYLQPLTIWLHNHPEWALVITFLISFSESLAIIGSIIPGSLTMTAIGILAGSGVMRIDFTLSAAILGAIAGDSGSYFLGYFFSDRLANIWPFKRYPHWLSIGEDYFARHGGKSVLIGRFVGPLRSIIPVIAGMMHMSQWRFLLANTISAIGWSILYLGPGIVIGAASSELSAENATRFFMIILFLIGGFWLLSLLIKWLLIRANQLLAVNLNHVWNWSKRHPHLSKYFLLLTPKYEKNHYPTAALVAILLFCLLLTTSLIILALSTSTLINFNQAMHLFFQSIRIPEFDDVIIFLYQLISMPVLLTVFTASLVVSGYQRNYRLVFSYCSVFISSWIIAYSLSLFIDIPRPQGILVNLSGSSFPEINLTIATAFYGFLCFNLNVLNTSITARFLKILLLFTLPLSGFAVLYLGDYWSVDVLSALLIGLMICLLHWLCYRKTISLSKPHSFPSVFFTILLLITAAVTMWINYEHLIHNHRPYQKKYILTEQRWWHQKNPILPTFRSNRFGHKVNLLNIQYQGSLEKLKENLSKKGWKTYDQSIMTSLLNTMSAQGRKNTLPLLSQLHNNKKPSMLMTYYEKSCHCLIVFRLWKSNYHLNHINDNLWIGSMYINNQYKLVTKKKSKHKEFTINPALYLQLPVELFKIRQVNLPKKLKEQFKNGVKESIFLIMDRTKKNK